MESGGREVSGGAWDRGWYLLASSRLDGFSGRFGGEICVAIRADLRARRAGVTDHGRVYALVALQNPKLDPSPNVKVIHTYLLYMHYLKEIFIAGH